MQCAQLLISTYHYWRLDFADSTVSLAEPSVELLTGNQAETLQLQLSLDSEQERKRALEEQARHEMESRVPRWVWVVLLLLGWNELIAVLSNPLLLILLMFVGGASFYAHRLGVLMPTIELVGSTIKKQALSMLSPPPTSQQPSSASSSASSPTLGKADSKKFE